MPKFEYLVKDAQGRDMKGVQESQDAGSLISDFHKRGYVIVQINQVKDSPGLFTVKKEKGKPGGKKIKLEEMVIFSRQLATMINAGVPLVQSLDILAEQMENPRFQNVAGKLKLSVEGGKSFSEALEEHKKYFLRYL